jgi:integrase
MARPKSKFPWITIRGKYHYARTPTGNIALRSTPGTPAFNLELEAAFNPQSVPQKPRRAATNTIAGVIDAYLDSPDFLDRAPRTQFDYRQQSEVLRKKFGTMDVAAFAENPAKVRGYFLEYRNQIFAGGLPLDSGGVSRGSKRQADYFMVFAKILLSWAVMMNKAPVNPLLMPRGKGVKLLYKGTRADKIWSDAQIDDFRSRASKEIDLALMLALWTGQRQGDLLRLTWADYDGDWLELEQGKTRVRVAIPVARPLKRLLDATPRRHDRILVNQEGRPWTAAGFHTSWYKTAQRVQVKDRTFHDLRGTAVVKFARAGATELQVSSITGHSTHQIATILKKHYLGADRPLAQSAMNLREAMEKPARLRFVNTAPPPTQPIDIIGPDFEAFTKFSQQIQSETTVS